MHVTALICLQCDESYPADEVRYECRCGGSLDVQYDYAEIQDAVSWEALRRRPFTHARYREFLPVVEPRHLVSLEEGGTPIVESRTIGPDHGLDNLCFKLEGRNPTGSFKDRGTVVELGKGLDFGADEVVVASTGNMGASIAAYAARAGMTARIFVPETVGGPKRKQMEAHGATLELVDGDYDDAAHLAWDAYEQDGTYLMGDYPYRGEGEKTVGHEIVDQTDADTVICPVGNGTLIHGVWKGMDELRRVGLAAGVPRFVGVQATGCNTVVRALGKGFETPRPVETVDTVAGAIACADPLDGDGAMQAITDSGGFGVAVSDDEIMQAKALLAEQEGIYAEEAAAAGLAGVLKQRDRFDQDERIVCLITGHGLKT